MDLNRRVCDRLSFMVLLLGHTAAATVLPGINQKNGFNFDCTNDFDKLMLCQLELQNCTEYSMTLSNKDSEKNCTLQQCGTGKCCCDFQMTFTIGTTYTAKVLKDGKTMESKVIKVTESLKPKTPTIKLVKESNGNIGVSWNSTMMGFINNQLTAEVTYYKKGETTKISKSIIPAIVDGLNYYEINGQELDPNSTYIVSVRSFIKLSGRFSDSSTEWEFKTPFATASSRNFQLLVIVISLSIVAVIFSVAIYGLHVKLKTMLWDEVPKPPNKILNTDPSEQRVLKLEPPITYSVCIEPLIPDDSKLGSKTSLTDTSSGTLQQSSGVSTGSSALSYTNTGCPAAVNGDPPIAKAAHDALSKIFPNICPISPPTATQSNNTQESGLFSAPCHPCGIQTKDPNFGSSVFENKTYSFLIPGFPHQTLTNNLEVQVKAEMPCDSEYQPTKSNMVNCPFQQEPACQVPAQQGAILPQVVSPMVSTDISYQEVPISVPKGSHSFLAVDDDYQAFPSQVRQPDVFLLEQRNREHKEHLDKWEEKSFTKSPQSTLSPVVPVQDGQHVSELQIPFFSLVSSNPIITDDGYQSV
ncbi:uncharacterized protein LOC115776475 isoform X2 [Archocentrus centrarchus]|uniref:uncharacterized protein LOC115776475 isoform X2 n=1 Tax=Archocentrus centrarchus TaxID=63155 RepID=UPI0011EA486C|nr:uncharacterized protein LOC115776475 isoform X2 [Archocentrus centrarchus]